MRRFTPMGIPAGTPVGPYHVISQLGAGGMGEVYRAHDPRLSRDVALKVIRRVLSVGADAQDDALDRLLREAILASALNHPNIVTIYETGVVDADRYIAMELIEGSDAAAGRGTGPRRSAARSASPGRSPRRSPSRMPRRSSIATSSRTT